MNGRCLVILAAVVLSILQEQRQVEGMNISNLEKNKYELHYNNLPTCR